MRPHVLTRLRAHGLLLAGLTLAVPALVSPASVALAVIAALVLPFVTMSVLDCEIARAGGATA